MSSIKRWQLHPQQSDLCNKISAELSVDPVISQLLLNRGISSLRKASIFLDKSDSGQRFVFAESDHQRCSDIVYQAIADQRPILLYGDYDVDGMTSVSIMLMALESCGAKVQFYIPDRFREGYGLQASVLQAIKDQGIGLLITLDCGVSNVKEISAIKSETPCQVLVFDHHQLPDPVAPADGMLNPCTLPDDDPATGLCTAGIAYAFICDFFQRYFSHLDPSPYLDLVALGTVADVAPLHGLNRSWTHHGLRLLGQRKRLGISALLEAAKFKGDTVSARDVGFTLAPRLNAAGRLASASLGVRLLIATSEDVATQLAFQLETLNLQRRDIGAKMVDEALELQSDDKRPSNVTILSNPNWHAGVIGITASRLVEHFSKPAILVSGSGPLGRGSARTVGSVNVYALLRSCRDHFLSFGGHKQAAGFTVSWDQIDAFKSSLIEKASAIDPLDLQAIIDVDAELTPKQLTLDLAKQLSTLEPFGVGNQAPLFFCDGLKALALRPVGNGQHIKATLSTLDEGLVIDAIGFNLAEKLAYFNKTPLRMVFRLTVNHWQGRSLPQLEIVDLK